MITVKLSRANFFKIAVQYWTRRQSDRGDGSRDANSKSLSENSVESCGEGFWLQPRRRGRSIPAAGCDGRANAGRSQKTRRPERFRGKGRLASLLLGHSPTAGMLPRRASPSSLFHENRTPHNFQTGSQFFLRICYGAQLFSFVARL